MLSLAVYLLLLQCAGAQTNHYLFVGHPRDDNPDFFGPGQIVQREVERVDYGQYDLLMLGGDYTWQGTTDDRTVSYLDAVFSLHSANVLAALGNHDTQSKTRFTNTTGRPTYYAFKTNNITFVVLDTTNDGQDIEGGELQMLEDTVNSLSNSTHLVLIHHHIIWMADYPPLAHLYNSPKIGASSHRLTNLNFYDEVYPLLLQAQSNGVEVICVAGDRTGAADRGEPATYEEFYIDHTTSNGIHFLAAGLKEELPAAMRTVIEWEHNIATGELTWQFVHLTDLPTIPDEPIVISELHYDPPTPPGNDWSFVELYNRGDTPYDLSGAWFEAGVGFTNPPGTVLAPGERILVAAVPDHYTNTGVRVFDYEGSDKPNSDDPIWLRDSRDLEIDYVAYGVDAPWPSEPDNHGPSLVLIDSHLDNNLPENWTVSDSDAGTPGEPNFLLPESRGGLKLTGGTMRSTWQDAVTGRVYRAEYTPDLVNSNWMPLGGPVTATVSQIVITDTNAASDRQRFYRLRRMFGE